MSSITLYIANYVNSGGIAPRFRAQLQLQMLLTGCAEGYFAVASLDFEKSGQVSMYRDVLKVTLLLPLIEKAEYFCHSLVYPQLAAGRLLVPQ